MINQQFFVSIINPNSVMFIKTIWQIPNNHYLEYKNLTNIPSKRINFNPHSQSHLNPNL